MGVREIVSSPDPVLRQPARRVRAFSPELQALIEDMIETMRAAPGVGLAAPQIGLNLRLIVMEYAEPGNNPEDPPKQPRLYVLANPEIVRHSKETTTDHEGCLSLPGLVGQVERYESVTVKGLNRQGKSVRIRAKGWLARILQHEIDHINGKLYIDRTNDVWRLEESEVEEPPSV